MYTVLIGQFVLNLEIVLYLAAGLAGAGAIRLKLKEDSEKRGSAAASAVVNAVIIWIIVWKGSQLLFTPSEVLANPLALLYFSGGVKGVWLASIVSIGYLLYKLGNQGHDVQDRVELVLIAALAWGAVHSGFNLLLIDENIVYYALGIVLSVVLLGYMLLRYQSNGWNGIIAIGLWLSLGRAAISFADDNRLPVLLSFGISQLVWLALALLLLVGLSLADSDSAKSNNKSEGA